MREKHEFEFGPGGHLKFQDGPVKENGVNGTQADIVIEAVLDYLKEINRDFFANRETSLAITRLEEALHWLAARTKAREARGVEGTSQP